MRLVPDIAITRSRTCMTIRFPYQWHFCRGKQASVLTEGQINVALAAVQECLYLERDRVMMPRVSPKRSRLRREGMVTESERQRRRRSSSPPMAPARVGGE